MRPLSFEDLCLIQHYLSKDDRGTRKIWHPNYNHLKAYHEFIDGESDEFSIAAELALFFSNQRLYPTLSLRCGLVIGSIYLFSLGYKLDPIHCGFFLAGHKAAKKELFLDDLMKWYSTHAKR